MKSITRIAALMAFSIAGSCASYATSIGSYGTGNAGPTGFDNTPVLFTGSTSPSVTSTSTTTYNIPTGGIWAAPVGGSSWVSYAPNTYPGGGNYPANGLFSYSTTFQDSDAANSTGTITVMADDTTDVFLNGVTIATAAGANPAAHCTVSTPNCTMPVTFNLTGFQDGTNTLSFVVHQDFNNATGLDFAATVASTPEPGSLMLLGTGLLGIGGQLYRRRKTA